MIDQHDQFDVVAGGCLAALRGEHPGAGNPAERRNPREDQKAWGSGEDIAMMSLGSQGSDRYEAEMVPFRLHDEAELVPVSSLRDSGT